MTEKNELDLWLDELYKPETNQVSVEFAGRNFTFNKYFSSKIMFQLMGLPEEQQISKLIAILSINPVIKEDQVAKLPTLLLAKMQQALGLTELLKKNG